MKCAEVRELLGNYMDQELTEAMMQRVEKHLLRCPACAYEARSVERVRELLRQGVESPMVSEQLGERILHHLMEHFPHLQASSPEQELLSLPLLPED